MNSLKTIFGLAYQNLKNKKIRTFLVVLNVSLGVAALFFFLSFVSGMQKFLYGQLLTEMDPRQLIVSYQYKNVGFFQSEEKKEIKLDDAFLEKMREVEGIEKVTPQLVLTIPVKLEVDFWNKFFETDVPVYGMDFDFLELEHKVAIQEDILPVVISSRLLDVYNLSLAESSGLPRLSEEGVLGRNLEIIFGESSFFKSQAENIQKKSAQIFALSDDVPLMGITISLEQAEKVLREYNSEEGNLEYSTVYLVTEDEKYNAQIQKDLQTQGLKVQSFQEAEKSLNQVVWYLRKLVQVAGAIVLLIALLAVSMALFMSVLERKQEIGILRALGMQRKKIAFLILSEGFLIGILAYFLGILIGLGGIKITDYFLIKLTSEAAFRPSSFFNVEFSQLVFVFGFILFFILFASFFPARKASRLDPLEALLN